MATKREELKAFKTLKKHFEKGSLTGSYTTWSKDDRPTYRAVVIDTSPGIYSIGDLYDPMKAVESILDQARKMKLKKGGNEE